MISTMITAHSGCEGTPDNSIASILKGIELHADCVEIDINGDDHGHMYLSHDALEDYAAAVPLEQALRLIAESGVGVNCDLKQDRLLYPVLSAAEKVGLPRERLFFSGSVDVGALLRDPGMARRARIFLNTDRILCQVAGVCPDTLEEQGACIDAHLDDIAALLKRTGAEAMNPYYRLMPSERLRAARKKGISLSLWTVNDEEDQARLLSEDILNLTTRRPQTALRLRDSLV